MKRLLFAALCVLFFPLAALADAPKETYTADESATILTAATVVGALGYCHDRKIYENRTAERLYYRIAAHMKPHFGEETAEGMISSTALEFLQLARNTGRYAVIQHDVSMSKFFPAQIIEVRTDKDCESAERLADNLMRKGALFDNDVAIPGEIGA